MPEPSTERRSIAPLFVALALLMAGNGLQGSLIGIRASLERFPTFVTGLVIAAYYGGFLLGSMATPRFLWEVGHVRVYAGLASLASAAVLVEAVFVNAPVWVAFRLLTGFCLAGLFVAAESWMNASSGNRTRGRLIGTYMVVVMGGNAAGQLLLNAADPVGVRLFILASVLVSLAVVPIAMVGAGGPELEVARRMPVREILRVAPLGVVGILVVGMGTGALLGMGPVWATISEVGVTRVSVFMLLTLVGGTALQWPLGLLSDHVSRRRVILGVTLAAAVAAAVTAPLPPGSALVLAGGFVVGATVYPMYSLCVSHINDFLPGETRVAAASAIIFVYGVGSLLGPLVVAGVMHLFGAASFWWSLAGIHGSLGLYAVYRLIVRTRIDLPRKPRYMPIPARSGALLLHRWLPGGRHRTGP